jgi:hypothetical protein
MRLLQCRELRKVPDRSRQRTAETSVEGKIPAMQTHTCHELPGFGLLITSCEILFLDKYKMRRLYFLPSIFFYKPGANQHTFT